MTLAIARHPLLPSAFWTASASAHRCSRGSITRPACSLCTLRNGDRLQGGRHYATLGSHCWL